MLIHCWNGTRFSICTWFWVKHFTCLLNTELMVFNNAPGISLEHVFHVINGFVVDLIEI